MAVVKNMIVRVGADLSRFQTGFSKAAGTMGNFGKQSKDAMKGIAAEMKGLKIAAIEDGKSNAGIVSLTDQIRALKEEQSALQSMGFSWGFNRFEENEAQLRSLTAQLEEYKENLNSPSSGPKEWVSQLRELQNVPQQMGFADMGFSGFDSHGQKIKELNTKIDQFAAGLRESVDCAQPLGEKLSLAKNALKEMERIGLGAGDVAWDDMYQTVVSLTDGVREYKAALATPDISVEDLARNLRDTVDSAGSLGLKLQNAQKALKELEFHGLGAGDADWDDMYQTVVSLTDGVREYKAALVTPDISVEDLARNLRDTVDSAGSLGLKLQNAQKALKELEFHGLGAGDADWDDMYQTVFGLTQEVKEYKAVLEGVGDATEGAVQKTGGLGTAVKSAFGWLSRAGSKLLGLGKHANSSTPGVEKLLRSIRRIGIVSVGLRLVKSIFGELQSVVNQYVSQNAALQAQVTALKNSLGQALAPAINLVTNALSALMPYVVGVSNAIGSLITNLFGSGWTTVADGANAAASAIGGAGSAQKEFNRQLAGFDEITKLSKESSGGGGGASSVATAVEGKTPAWLTSLSQQTQQAASQGDFFGIGAALANAVNTGINSINLSDTTFGSKIADFINGGIAGATGFVETMDWSGLGTAIKNNVVGLIGGIDWAGIWRLLGSLAGGLGAALVSMFGDAFSGLGESIANYTELCGGDLLAGILLGITKGIVSIGVWIKDNMLLPFVEGFKNVFDIHSPSQNEEINSLGKNIMLGIFEGIAEPLRDPVGWLKENVLAPLVDAFKKVFGEGSWISQTLSNLIFGETDVGLSVEGANSYGAVKKASSVEAVFTGFSDSIPTKKRVIDNFSAVVRSAEDNVRNKILPNGRLVITSMADSVGNKTLGNGRLTLTSVADSVSNKTLGNGRLTLTSVADSVGNKTLGNGQLTLTSVADSVSNKTLGNGRLNLTTLADSVGNKTLSNGRLVATSMTDSVSNKTISGGKINVTSWKDSLGDKTLSMKADVVKGWVGSLVDKLGISTIKTKLDLKVPTITIDWAYTTVFSKTFKYPKGFDIKWNATGAILNGAQIFGRAGNTWLGGGEAGREALLPLDRNTWWMDKVADRVALKVSGSNQAGEHNITVNLVVDGKVVASTVVRHVNAQARATGKHPFAAYI